MKQREASYAEVNRIERGSAISKTASAHTHTSNLNAGVCFLLVGVGLSSILNGCLEQQSYKAFLRLRFTNGNVEEA